MTFNIAKACCLSIKILCYQDIHDFFFPPVDFIFLLLPKEKKNDLFILNLTVEKDKFKGSSSAKTIF